MSSLLENEKPEIFTYLNNFIVTFNEDNDINCYFYKFTGIYFIICKSDYHTSIRYFNDKNIYEQCIDEFKKIFICKEIEILEYEKYNITKSDNECYFYCPLCDYYLYRRFNFWNKIGWKQCEKEGINLYLGSQIKMDDEQVFNNFKFDIDNEVNIDSFIIKSIDDFVNFIDENNEDNGSYYCDYCDNNKQSNYMSHQIYFCRKCEEKNNEYKKNIKENEFYDVFNLCKLCYNEDNIKKHQIDFPEHDDFYIKENNTLKYKKIINNNE